MKIYTKTGDRGETSLYGGNKVSKGSDRVEAYGNIDELNAFIGSAKTKIVDEKILVQLRKIQYNLFTLGAEVATPQDKLYLANGKPRLPETISLREIQELENWIDDFQVNLPELQYFILPAGGEATTALHISRTVCRRAERSIVKLYDTEEIRSEIIQYLNRLSDYLFVVGRVVAFSQNELEEYWIPRK